MDPWFVFERALELRGVDLEEEEATSEEATLLGLVSNERFLAIPFLPFIEDDIFLWAVWGGKVNPWFCCLSRPIVTFSKAFYSSILDLVIGPGELGAQDGSVCISCAFPTDLDFSCDTCLYPFVPLSG